MKLPETVRTHCPFCNTHTEHEVSIAKKGKVRKNSIGTRKFERVKKGYGGMPRTPKKHVYKTGKRPLIMLKCTVCKKKHQKTYHIRTKKAVVIGKQ